MNLFSKNRKLFGAMAILAILLPSLAFAALNPVLDSVGLYQAANRSNSESWGTSVSAAPDQTINLMVHVHNDVLNTTATGVRVQATLPVGEVTNYTSRAVVSSTNASSVSGNININLSESARIEYIPGSTVMYNHANQVEANLPDGITAGGITVLPELQGCWEYERFVIFRARIVAAPESVRVRIVKYNDANGNGRQDGGEVALSGWQFRVTGPNFDRTVATDASGVALIDNLPRGTYTVTEIGQAGWSSTTSSSVTRMVTTDPATQTFVFGNRRVVIPGCESPENANSAECQITSLPSSGPAEMAGMLLGSLAVTGGALAYLRSKKQLKDAYKK
jgi:hypothetical protein